MHFRVSTLAVLLVVSALPAGAQQSVKLRFHEGQVTLSAQNAPVRVILAEWARLGGATIVNGDRVAGPPVTIELTGVPERQALDIVLRSVAGYMLAPRRAGTSGASEFDRILILPTSAAPRNPTPATAAGGARPAFPRPVMARRPEPGVEGEPVPEGDPLEDPTLLNQPRGDQRVIQPPFVMRPPTPPEDDADDAKEEEEDPDSGSSAGVAPTPGNPFGVPVGSSARPGVVTPAPKPNPQQQQPGTNRPPPNRVQ